MRGFPVAGCIAEELMNTEFGLENCLSFINCNLQAPHARFGDLDGEQRTAITLSRQAGSGGHAVAEKLLQILQDGSPGQPWAMFDKNLVEKVLEDHHLPNRLARFMPEDRISELSGTMDELFGLHPPSEELVRKAAETILQLAELGNVILLGRGANVITSRLKNAFHVRLVAPVEKRVKFLQEQNGISAKAALEMLERLDLGRRRYLKKYFGKDIDDPVLYHLVINTDCVGHENAARIIAEAVKVPKLAT